jgi:hypothetical protein
MAAVADPFQSPPFGRPQPRRAPGQDPLPQGRRTIRQRRPAARAPDSSSGLSPTCQA